MPVSSGSIHVARLRAKSTPTTVSVSRFGSGIGYAMRGRNECADYKTDMDMSDLPEIYRARGTSQSV